MNPTTRSIPYPWGSAPNHWIIAGNLARQKGERVVLGSGYRQETRTPWVLRRPSFAGVGVTRETLGFRAFLTPRAPR